MSNSILEYIHGIITLVEQIYVRQLIELKW